MSASFGSLTPLQQPIGEVRAVPQLRDRQIHDPARVSNLARAVAVALIGPRRCAGHRRRIVHRLPRPSGMDKVVNSSAPARRDASRRSRSASTWASRYRGSWSSRRSPLLEATLDGLSRNRNRDDHFIYPATRHAGPIRSGPTPAPHPSADATSSCRFLPSGGSTPPRTIADTPRLFSAEASDATTVRSSIDNSFQ